MTAQEKIAADHWLEHPFYSDDTIALGIDIGIKGIGICVRKGRSIIYSKTLVAELPDQSPLAARRQMRAARRARKNRKVRMNRLRRLFEEHGLPWIDETDPAFTRSDPFELRHRAMQKGVSSSHALAICVRHVVLRRGFDFFSQAEGEYPWGSQNSLAEARKWLASAFVDEETATGLRQMADELEGTEKARSQYLEAIEERLAWSAENSIENVLEAYAKESRRNRKPRARGHNFPRRMVEAHLRRLIERNQRHLRDPKGFIEALFIPCKTADQKEKAIFHYQRKTPEEARAHFRKKQAVCPMAEHLGLGDKLPRSNSADPSVRRWNLLDFMAHRRFLVEDLETGARETRHLPEEAVRAVVEIALGSPKPSWKEARSLIQKAWKPGFKLVSGTDWNRDQLKQLEDLVKCGAGAARRKSSLSSEAAAKLAELAAGPDLDHCDPEGMRTRIKEAGVYQIRGNLVLDYGLYPQAELLLGRPGKGKKSGSFATKGFLQRLFEGELAEALGGRKCPDYCIIETTRSVSRNQQEKSDREREIRKRRTEKEKRLREAGYDPGQLGRWAELRLRLYQQQEGKCPFTGEDLPPDPFSESIELAHLFPDSRGGLSMDANLVVTTRKVNRDMGNRTPREAAAAGLPGWLSWSEMQDLNRTFRWPRAKRVLFEFEPEGESRFPEFENLTRTSQLARQLQRLAQMWMGVGSDEAGRRERIGLPHGALTAAARRSWTPKSAKRRSDFKHHMIDAAVLSFMPPGTGLNKVECLGIFTTRLESKRTTQGMRVFPVIHALSALAPDLSTLLGEEDEECPVIKRRSKSRHRSLGDSTFWGVDLQSGVTRQRTPLSPEAKGIANLDAAGLSALLHQMGIPPEKIPSHSNLQRWLEQGTDGERGESTLILNDGTPVKNFHKFGGKGRYGGKGSLKNPIGWSGVTLASGTLDQVRSLNLKYAEARLYLGWDGKKKSWVYTTYRIPDPVALRHLRRFGWRWTSTHGLPEFLRDELKCKNCRSLKELICGKLPPYARQMGTFRRGDTFRLSLGRDGKPVAPGNEPVWRAWFEVSAIMANGKIKFKCLTHSHWEGTPMETYLGGEIKAVEKSSPGDLATILGLSPPDMQANDLGLRPPQ